MGVWDAIYYTGDLVKGAGGATYRCTSAAVIKIDQVVRVDGIQKLPQYFPDSETRSQIAVFTTIFAKNAGKYALYEGFKNIPGATVASKLVKDTMREVKQVNQKDRMKAIEEKVDRLEKDLKKKSTSQPENLSKRGDLISSQKAGGGLIATTLAKNTGEYAVYEGYKHFPGATVASKLVFDTMGEVNRDNHNDGMKAMLAKVERFEEHMNKSGGDEAEKTKDIITVFMKSGFVGNHMFNDSMVSKIARMEKKNE